MSYMILSELKLNWRIGLYMKKLGRLESFKL